MKLEEIYEFEKYSVSGLVWIMVKYFNYHRVEVHTQERANVESGVWITINITVAYFDDGVHRHGNEWIISAQRPDIASRRLADYLKERHPKPDW